MSEKRLPITGLPLGGVAPAVLVCGDPARAEQTAASLEQASLFSNRREYHAFQGLFEGMPLVVCSHGVGAAGAAIAFEELIAAGARRIIRIGTCGALQPDIEPGELIAATAAVQNTGYGRETAPPGYPAVADLELTLALRRAAAQHGRPWRTGLILTRDNFYPGVAVAGAPDYALLAQAQVLAVEMEAAALFLIGSLRQVQTAAILAVDGNLARNGRESMSSYRPHQEVVATAVAEAIAVALRALRSSHTP